MGRERSRLDIRHLPQQAFEVSCRPVAALARWSIEAVLNGLLEFRQAYARLAMREVTVTDKEIRISGSKAVLARAAAQGLDSAPPGVLSFVREWRTR